MPSSFVVPDVLKSDVRLFTSTCAPCTGLCCGSCTMALTVPKTEAIAGKHESSASKLMIAINRFDIFISPEEPLSGSIFLSATNTTGFTLSQRNPQKVGISRNNARFDSVWSRDNLTLKIESAVTFSGWAFALDEGRTAISMGRKAGNCEDNRSKLEFKIAHCRWRKIRIGGNCCAAPQMSRRAAIHRTLGVIRRG